MRDLSLNSYKYFNAQAQFYKSHQAPQFVPGFVTISRQAGAGGVTIAQKVASHLNEALPNACAWTVFDRNLVQEVIKEHNLSEKMQAYLEEECHPELQDMLEDMFGVHPSQDTLVSKTSKTILHLARMGRCVIVGGGAPVITKSMPLGFHVRLVGSLKRRIDRIKEYYKLNDKEAAIFIEKEDKGRAQYLKKYFETNIDDPLLYHLTINTDRISPDDTALLIKDMLINNIIKKLGPS